MWAGWSTFATGCNQHQMDTLKRKQKCFTKPTHKRPHCPPSHCFGHSGKLRLKVLVVVAEDCFQKFGHLEVPAPAGVSVNKETNRLMHQAHLEIIGQPILTPEVLHDKLVNEGFVRAKLWFDNPDPHPCPDVRKLPPQIVEIPFQSIHDIPGIKPGDHVQEFAEVEGLFVTGALKVNNSNSVGNCANLDLKVVLRVKVIVARECLVSVSGKVEQCPPDDC